MKFFKKFSVRIVSMAVIALLIYSVLIAIANYNTAKGALLEKGKLSLKNTVILAQTYIETEHQVVENGGISRAEAEDKIKNMLLGPLESDGTRKLHRNIDLGENAYFIIYDRQGYEIMHPTLEGDYVYDVVDFSSEKKYIVREQIEMALNGGGYVDYKWNFPHSKEIGNKISYVSYFPDWDWIIIATAYEEDIIDEAQNIVHEVTLISMMIIICLSLLLSLFIQKMTKPIEHIVKGMGLVALDKFDSIPIYKSSMEIEMLSTGYNTMIQTLSKSKSAIEEQTLALEKLAYHDTLTGLENRLSLKRKVTNFLASEAGSGVFILLDIANLQTINSTLGYQYGNMAIRAFSDYLKGLEDEENFIARSGSNEFSVWLSYLTENDAADKVRQIVEGLKEHFFVEGYKTYVNIHAIYVYYDVNELDSFESLYEKASTAMHLAKKDSDFLVHSYDEAMKNRLEYEISMHEMINEAIKGNAFIPYYQKKVNYQSGKVEGFEALARWFSDQMGYVTPGVFIPFISKFNKENEFFDMIIRKILLDQKKLQRFYGDDIHISVNVSPNAFLEASFVDKISKLVHEFDIQPHQLVLEITEDVIIDDTKKASKIIGKLHSLGIDISIDDFGSGYSSLNYLLTLNPDEIKIDKSIVDQIVTSDKSFYLFNTVCELAETFGYHIVAEGVEKEEQLDKIKETSLTTIQGYYFAKPEPIEKLIE